MAYADNIIIMGNAKQDVANIMNLMKVDRYMGLSVNRAKVKYMYMTRNVRDDKDIWDFEVDEISFQQV